jgi:hypothetical protein
MTYSSHRTGWLSERRPHGETARADHSNAQCLPRPQNDGEGPLISIGSWFDRIDPGTHRRIKGLRLVTAFGLAALLAIVPHISRDHAISLGPLAAGFALWASVSEAKTTRYESARDLAFLCIAAGLGAASLVIFTSLFGAGF